MKLLCWLTILKSVHEVVGTKWQEAIYDTHMTTTETLNSGLLGAGVVFLGVCLCLVLVYLCDQSSELNS